LRKYATVLPGLKQEALKQEAEMYM